VNNVRGIRRCLECRIGPGRVVFAAEFVAVLGEYVVGARLPLIGRRRGAGAPPRDPAAPGPNDLEVSLGVWAGHAVLSLSVVAHESALSRAARGILLRTGESGLRWAFEIDAPIGLVEVDRITATAPDATAWQRQARLPGGRLAPYIDLPALLRELAEPAEASPA